MKDIRKLTKEKKEEMAQSLLFVEYEAGRLPEMWGGIDYIEHQRNGVSLVFHDIGINYRGVDYHINLATQKIRFRHYGAI